MVRAIVSVVVGYAVMFVMVVATFTGAYMLLGPEATIRPGVYDVART